LVWHYRLANTVAGQTNVIALRAALAPLAERYNLRVHFGKKILEVRSAGVNKGMAAKRWLAREPDFALATGDDYTDEDTFRAMPSYAYTVKVGAGRTTASLRASKVDTVLELLNALTNQS
jgi:trehalose 6-phosphate synthase/phosphatase